MKEPAIARIEGLVERLDAALAEGNPAHIVERSGGLLDQLTTELGELRRSLGPVEPYTLTLSRLRITADAHIGGEPHGTLEIPVKGEPIQELPGPSS